MKTLNGKTLLHQATDASKYYLHLIVTPAAYYHDIFCKGLPPYCDILLLLLKVRAFRLQSIEDHRTQVIDLRNETTAYLKTNFFTFV